MQNEVASINVKYADCYKIVMHTYMYSERLHWKNVNKQKQVSII